MITKIFGLCFIMIGFLGVYFVYKNKSNMPSYLFMYEDKDYEVINKQKFNNIMVIQDLTMVLWIGIVGYSVAVFENVMLGLATPLINIIFSMIGKKYIALK